MTEYVHLITDPAHWAFEITLIALFDGLIGIIIWPRIKKFSKHHKKDDNKLEILWKEYLKKNQKPLENSDITGGGKI